MKTLTNGAAGTKSFRGYVSYLEGLTQEATAANFPIDPRITAALDGEPSARVRSTFSVKTLRRTGAFFTGQELAARAVGWLAIRGFDTLPIIDPAYGAGDLLVACARHFSTRDSGQATLQSWGWRVIGYDLNADFIRATKARLALSALQQGESRSVGDTRFR